VVCLRRARILLVPAVLLRGVLTRESHVVADLAADVSRLIRMVQNLSAGSVQRRLASVLVDLADRAGEPFPGGILVPLRLKRADLASLAATTLESASRAETELSRDPAGGGVSAAQPAGPQGGCGWALSLLVAAQSV
jgi:CRP-like cAMP-binding protein